MQGLGSGLMAFAWIFLLVLAIAWIIMPFAIIGTKPILRELLDAVKENNKLTRELLGTTSGKPLYVERKG